MFSDDRSAAEYVSTSLGAALLGAASLGAASLGGAPAHRGPTIRLTGGDLFRSLGSPVVHDGTVRVVPVDALVVTHDDETMLAVAHVVVRRAFWRGEVLVAMNATHVGALDLGPRAHPNDGLMDVTEGSLGPRERLAARRRARSGAHVPHPQLRTSRVRQLNRTFVERAPIRCDGRQVGVTRSLQVEVLPDAFQVAI